jgi:hypothetical protein
VSVPEIISREVASRSSLNDGTIGSISARFRSPVAVDEKSDQRGKT